MAKYEIHITQDAGQWKVIRNEPGNKVSRGQDIEWTLDRPADGRPVSAHFQFADHDLVHGGNLTRDLTAEIAGPGGTLALKVRDDADRRRNPRHYAVWIMDSALKRGGVYAVCETGNPPPELEIGP